MAVVTDGLVGYWHYKQGFKGSVWENITPQTKGKYNALVTGATLQSDGIYFDGVDDKATVLNVLSDSSNITLEITYKLKKRTELMPLIGISEFGLLLFNFPPDQYGYMIGDDSSGGLDVQGTLPIIDTLTSATYTLNTTNKNTGLYVNGVKIAESNDSYFQKTGKQLGISIFSMYGDFSNGLVISAKIYNKILTSQEVAQNYAVGTAVGLDDPPPVSAPPSVTIVSQSRQKLSPVPPMNTSTLNFKFDQDVTDWAVMVLGSDYSTGTIAGSGKNVIKDAEISVAITHSMLYQEGVNRINIYGRNKDGQWTPYN